MPLIVRISCRYWQFQWETYFNVAGEIQDKRVQMEGRKGDVQDSQPTQLTVRPARRNSTIARPYVCTSFWDGFLPAVLTLLLVTERHTPSERTWVGEIAIIRNIWCGTLENVTSEVANIPFKLCWNMCRLPLILKLTPTHRLSVCLNYKQRPNYIHMLLSVEW